jgi:hypothetical protein
LTQFVLLTLPNREVASFSEITLVEMLWGSVGHGVEGGDFNDGSGFVVLWL